MRVLIIETSGADCSVAVAVDGFCVWQCCNDSGGGSATSRSEHSRLLAPYVAEAIAACGVPDAVAVSYGPGSYTGLRIGLSTAKGICFGAGVPLILIDSLSGLVCRAMSVLANDVGASEIGSSGVVDSKIGSSEIGSSEVGSSGVVDSYFLCPMVDARRMEVYTALYSPQGAQVSDISPLILGGDSFAGCARVLCVFGSGAAKSVELLRANGLRVHHLDGVVATAADFCSTACAMYSFGAFADVAYAEPLYLKEWQSTSTPSGGR